MLICVKKIENRKLSAGFTLVELMIVVAILGILAAIALPEFQGHIQKAKESAAKDNLRILRETIERYAAEHNGVPPGYPPGNLSAPSVLYALYDLVLKSTNASGQVADIGTPGYPYGPYLPKVPQNPFNEKNNIVVIGNSTDFPTTSTKIYGWIYKPATKEIRLDYNGTDSEGVRYLEY